MRAWVMEVEANGRIALSMNAFHQAAGQPERPRRAPHISKRRSNASKLQAFKWQSNASNRASGEAWEHSIKRASGDAMQATVQALKHAIGEAHMQ